MRIPSRARCTTIGTACGVEAGLDRRHRANRGARLALQKVETRDGIAGQRRLGIAAHVAGDVLDWGGGRAAHTHTKCKHPPSTFNPLINVKDLQTIETKIKI